ncbi:DUF3943 domain-containing protein [Geomonas subterranea]|uniref:DUF3943 domain-containing protein n=1 Tax=Geomonas subterranea TaxID=2847989 RepID=A0ABX8LEY2_9BACT|nr:DUF3943 domain-containing protein [Geomonas subterranea]QXE89200.1 DUF3943 domain-containing protein [Geomonas subterranea]QXM08687.1 DUF3943 domain-containing protein [Geomonas subterranea]
MRYSPGSAPVFLLVIMVLCVVLAAPGHVCGATATATDPPADTSAIGSDHAGEEFTWRVTSDDPSLSSWRNLRSRSGYTVAQNDMLPPGAKGAAPERPALDWETGEGKSYVVPALEIPAFIVLLNAFDRIALHDKKTDDGKRTYATNPSTFWHQLTHQDWTFDQDTFKVNQFGHPYEGATMYGLARSSGLNFWQSLVYSNAGSFLWEMAGENSRPSTNDLITTGNAGALLGEALFRMADLVLEEGGVNPPIGHRLAAAAISPPTAVNRLLFGKRFDTVFPNHSPATLWLCRAGFSLDVHSKNLTAPVKESSQDSIGIVEFSMAYGLPGKPGYSYHRPLDYFNFEISTRARQHNLVDTLTIRGLLKGERYEIGRDYRGIWGLYGSYDYISPYVFRVSSTALSLGTTAQYWISPGGAAQGSLLGGVGFGATGLESDVREERGYHYGVTPQVLLAMNFLFGDRAMVDLSGRWYYVSSVGPDHDGSESVFRGHSALTIRIHGNHALGLQYSESIRDTNYANILTKYRSEGTLSLVYTFVSDRAFGAVEWRDPADR